MRKAVIAWAFVLAAGLAAFLAARGRAQPAELNGAPTLHLENARIVALGDTIRFLDVPVGAGPVDVVGARPLRYFDFDCRLFLSADGVLRVEQSSAVPSPQVPSIEQFRPGTYKSGAYGFLLSGPARGLGGRLVWSTTGARISSWTTGPIQDNPDLKLQGLPADAVLLPGYAYGHTDTLIAVQQVRNQLTINYVARKTPETVPPIYVVAHTEVWDFISPK